MFVFGVIGMNLVGLKRWINFVVTKEQTEDIFYQSNKHSVLNKNKKALYLFRIINFFAYLFNVIKATDRMCKCG